MNEEFARLYLPPQPLGYRFEQQTDAGARPVEIVGIVANVLKDGNDRKPQPDMYVVARDRAGVRLPLRARDQNGRRAGVSGAGGARGRA